MRSSVKPGQSQLLIPLLIVITSAVVFAANTTVNMINASMNGSDPTGAYLYIPPQTQIETIMIEVWADTFIEAVQDGNSVKARLILDDKTPVSGQELHAYIRETLVSTLITDDQGYVEFIVPRSRIPDAKIVFRGNPQMFLNPSEFEMGTGEETGEIIHDVVENETVDNVTIDVLEMIQGEAEVEKPVKWTKLLRLYNKDLDEKIVQVSSHIP